MWYIIVGTPSDGCTLCSSWYNFKMKVIVNKMFVLWKLDSDERTKCIVMCGPNSFYMVCFKSDFVKEHLLFLSTKFLPLGLYPRFASFIVEETFVRINGVTVLMTAMSKPNVVFLYFGCERSWATFLWKVKSFSYDLFLNHF